MNNRTLLIGLGVIISCCFLVVCIAVIGYFIVPNQGFQTQAGEPAQASDQSSSNPPPTHVVVPDMPTIPTTPAPATEAPVAACPVSMQTIVEAAQYSVYDPETIPSDYEEPDTYTLVIYDVNGDEISNPEYESVPSNLEGIQNDSPSQQAAWDMFANLIPPGNREMVSEYLVFTDGEGNVLAAVEQSYDDPEKWIMEVDSADLEDDTALYFTIIHEYAHMLTLGPEQVPPDLDVYNNPDDTEIYESKIAACETYFPGEGCSLPDSYINVFYQRFWAPLVDEWQPIDDMAYDEDLNAYYELLYDFYLSHEDEFLDDYASTHPAEDIAETFAYFVFSPKPAGQTIAEQKILFFYEYPELVQLRTDILQSFCEMTP